MADKVVITGSAGLVGSESARFFLDKGFDVIGIDNDMRQYFFGPEASTRSVGQKLCDEYGERYLQFVDADIRDREFLNGWFGVTGDDIKLIIHCAAQPSHDWAAKEPLLDFDINAVGTINMLEAARQYCPDVPFIFTSTNKVYGDHPNFLDYEETETRFELPKSHEYYNGFDENYQIDQCKHSVFGASKVAADVMVQEYGRYFGMKTASFRGGCLTGPQHAGAQLHGFLSYLVKCVVTGKPYTIFGYKGKQVRDNIHCYDLANAFYHFYQNPRCGEVYNIGGSRHSNCSMMEAIQIAEDITGKKLNYTYAEDERIGDHKWWISDVSKFRSHYPDWEYKYGIRDIIGQIAESFQQATNT